VAAYDPGVWNDFFVACAGASAALAGLVFVAVSINIERILKFEGLPERSLSTLLLLVAVLLVSIVGLVPGQSRAALGAELLGVSIVTGGMIALFTARSRKGADNEPPSGFVLRVLFVAAGTLPLVIGAVSILADAGGGLYWILAGIVFAITGAVTNAWVLLVEILR
jgi:modulator of FtsH protease